MRPRRPVPEPPCENGVGARFTNGPVRDPYGHCPSSVAVAAVTPRAARRAAGRRTGSRDTRATPQAEGLVRARAEVCFHTAASALPGSLSSRDPCGKGNAMAVFAALVSAVGLRASIAAPGRGTSPAHVLGGKGVYGTVDEPFKRSSAKARVRATTRRTVSDLVIVVSTDR